jgi:hypothetical protein
VKGLLARACALDLRPTTLDVRNSGDTGGREHRDRVVGYGSRAFEYAGTAKLPDADRAVLIDGARRSIANGLRTGRPAKVRLGTFAAPLETFRAAFVTLNHGGRLRGCVGSILPHHAHRRTRHPRRTSPALPGRKRSSLHRRSWGLLP